MGGGGESEPVRRRQLLGAAHRSLTARGKGVFVLLSSSRGIG